VEVDATRPQNYGNSAAAGAAAAARVAVADVADDADGVAVAAVQSKRQQQKPGDSGPLPLLLVSQRKTSVQTDVWAATEVAVVVVVGVLFLVVFMVLLARCGCCSAPLRVKCGWGCLRVRERMVG